MKFLRTVHVLAIALLFVTLTNTSEAQIKPGSYLIVGSLNNGSGFHGKVAIKEAGPVSVKLNNNLSLKGRVDAKGNFRVSAVQVGNRKISAKGSVSMRNRSYAVSSNFSVKGQGKGIFMMGRL